MENKFKIIPIDWIYGQHNEHDEQPTGVLVQVSNGHTQYMTIEDYNKLTAKHTFVKTVVSENE